MPVLASCFYYLVSFSSGPLPYTLLQFVSQLSGPYRPSFALFFCPCFDSTAPCKLASIISRITVYWPVVTAILQSLRQSAVGPASTECSLSADAPCRPEFVAALCVVLPPDQAHLWPGSAAEGSLEGSSVLKMWQGLPAVGWQPLPCKLWASTIASPGKVPALA